MNAAAIHSLDNAIIYPEDMNVLKDALVELCARRGCLPDSPEATSIAIALLDSFQSGVNDVDRLVEAHSGPEA